MTREADLGDFEVQPDGSLLAVYPATCYLGHAIVQRGWAKCQRCGVMTKVAYCKQGCRRTSRSHEQAGCPPPDYGDAAHV